MMLFLAIVCLLASLVTGFMLAMANGMSDAPSSSGLSYLPFWIGLAISAALFVCWYFGWHHQLVTRPLAEALLRLARAGDIAAIKLILKLRV